MQPPPVEPQRLAAAGLVACLSLVALARAATPLLADLDTRPVATPPRASERRAALLPSAPHGAPTATQVSRLRDGKPIDLNLATAAELALLPRIGPKLAQRIVEYRVANGPFGRVAELEAVRGVGAATLARLAALVHATGQPSGRSDAVTPRDAQRRRQSDAVTPMDAQRRR